MEGQSFNNDVYGNFWCDSFWNANLIYVAVHHYASRYLSFNEVSYFGGAEISEDQLTKNVSLENPPQALPHGETPIEWDDHGWFSLDLRRWLQTP